MSGFDLCFYIAGNPRFVRWMESNSGMLHITISLNAWTFCQRLVQKVRPPNFPAPLSYLKRSGFQVSLVSLFLLLGVHLALIWVWGKYTDGLSDRQELNIFVTIWSRVFLLLVGAETVFRKLKRLHKRLKFRLLKSPAIIIPEDGRLWRSSSRPFERYSIILFSLSRSWPGG